MPFRTLAAMCCVIAFIAAPANAGANAARNLLLAMGFDTYLDSTSASFQAADNPLAADDAAMRRAWTDAAAQVFNADRMMADIAADLSTNLAEDDIAMLMGFYSAGLGARVTELEEIAQNPANSARSDTEGRAILAKLIADENPRLDAYQRMSDALGAIDSGAATAMNLSFALLNGIASSGKLPYQLTEDQILAIVMGQQDQIRSTIQQELFVSFAYTYRNLSDAELEEYIAFLTSDVGRGLYLKLNSATETVLQDRAHAFGVRFMELQSAQAL